MLSACTGMDIEDFRGTEPRLVVEEFFLGETRGWGMFLDRFGNVKRQFTMELDGRMENGVLVLEEDFHFRDGERLQRAWRIRRIDEHRYEGYANDVAGVARGRAHGQAVQWCYDFLMPIGGRTWRIHFDDWMLLQPGGVIINRAELSKFGIKLGEMIVFMTKPGQGGGDVESEGDQPQSRSL